MKNKLLNVKEVAELFGCGVSTIWRWTQNGILPRPIRIGGITRWHRNEIEKVLHSKSLKGEE
jgi:excisionase family DNA binding protein